MFCKDSMRIDIPHGCARESARLACNERLRLAQSAREAEGENKQESTDRQIIVV